ncbi:hypothetical protein OPV22_005720 [Ensete ventricosum]|uniref:Uncharacterized protein n=1 Tax=Ensete ventricosum TaxID=4639 RepID=A0AAV8RLM3_ENSVE|nr:hypothetical protein OPV22_005720 [Ensete ventricosum]
MSKNKERSRETFKKLGFLRNRPGIQLRRFLIWTRPPIRSEPRVSPFLRKKEAFEPLVFSAPSVGVFCVKEEKRRDKRVEKR